VAAPSGLQRDVGGPMSSVDTVEGLLAVWGRGAFTPDPLKSLADQGVVIGDALHQRLTAG